jgi:hypothetical protein
MARMTTPSRDELRAWTAALTPEPLDPSDPAETRYVELRDSGHGAMNAMMATIDLSLDTTTQLLSGPTGSGKTTELNRLRGDLEDAGYRVAMFDIADYVNMSSPISITETLVAVALGAHAALAPEQAEYGPGFVGRLRDLLGRLKVSLDIPGFTAEVSAEGMKVETLGVGVDVALQQELRSSRPFVDELRTKLGYNVGELYAEVAAFLQELFAAHPGELGSVLIVDGLEKLRSSHFSDTDVQESAEQLFVGQSGRLKFRSHHMIYTVPTYLQFTSPGALPYDLRVPVPVPHVRPRKGADPSTVTETIAELREAINRRIPVDVVFTGTEQIDRIIEASGGHLRDLFTLLQRLVNIIYQRTATLPVGDDDITRAINAVAQPFGQMTEEQEAFLREVDAGNGTVRPAAAQVQLMARLLVTHMLLGHLNGEDWYEVHPLTRRALGLP